MIFHSFRVITAPTDTDKGNLSLWRYSNDIISGKTLLYNYTGSDWANTIYVPKVGGKAVINRYINKATSQGNNCPFYSNGKWKKVDLQGVPWRDNNMSQAFYSCSNLTYVTGFNNSVISMESAFYRCNKLTTIPYFPSSVQLLQYAFSPSGIVSVPDIPKSVVNMTRTFAECMNIQGRINIYTTELNSGFNVTETFYSTNASLKKQVYIYYRYKNGAYTKTYNMVVANSTYKWHGKNGVTVYDLGTAPW